ncbi:MAG: class B sortase [Eubacteriales bacterium]|nr:class B sortase [Eubacteriales bacterium]
MTGEHRKYKAIKTEPSNAFISSVDSFTSDDIKCAPDNDKLKTIKPLIIRSLVMAVSFAVFCYSIYTIGVRMADDREQDELYSGIRPNKVEAASALSRPEELQEPNNMYTLLEMLSSNGVYNEYKGDKVVDEKTIDDYRQALLNVSAQNAETLGWIVFRGTEQFTENGIDYPIMLGSNEYYLKHNYKGEATKNGSIFASQELDRNFEANYNMLIYGHCMKNGSMFRAIKLWYDSANKNTIAKDMQIEIYTKDGLYIYELMSAYRSDEFKFTKTSFVNNSEYKAFLDDIYRRSTLNKKVKYSSDSKICTLVTCTNVSANPLERYVVHGILTQYIPYE